jgi:hypothetical protein
MRRLSVRKGFWEHSRSRNRRNGGHALGRLNNPPPAHVLTCWRVLPEARGLP